MKILLVSTNSKYIHSSLAVHYLKSAVDFLEIEILETTIKEDKNKLIEKILSKNADVIAFSCYIWNITYLKPIFEKIKSLCKTTKILLGGPEVSYNPQEVLDENPAVDYIICGEGEEPFLKFSKVIAKSTNFCDSDFYDIEGFCSKTKISTPFYSKNEPNSPYTDEYFNSLNGRIAYIESSRGCPFSCSFCLSGEGCSLHHFSLTNLFSNIEKLKKSGCKTIKFVDRTFNANSKRTKEILDYLIENYNEDDNVCFHFEIAADILTDKLIDAFNSAPVGLFQVEAGIQSVNENTLIAVRRKTDTKVLLQNLVQLQKPRNLHLHIDLIAGLPGEDLSSFIDGFNTVYNIRADMLQLGFLKLLHGSYMKKNSEFASFNKTPPYTVIKTDCLSPSDLNQLELVEYAVDKLYNSGRFSNLLDFAMPYFKNPYDLFLSFAKSVNPIFKEGLEDFFTRTFNYFSSVIGFMPTIDFLKTDWVLTNNKGALPMSLRQENMGILLREIDKIEGHRRKPALKRSAVALLSKNKILYVDYTDKNPVTGRYKGVYLPLTDDIKNRILLNS